jgi:hypothetical protein
MKKIGILTLFVLVALALTLTITVGAATPKAPAAVAVAPAPAPAAAVAAPMPPHPRVEHALEALRSAKDHMEHAEGEFHGHRAKAIEHIDQAIHEAEECMREP